MKILCRPVRSFLIRRHTRIHGYGQLACYPIFIVAAAVLVHLDVSVVHAPQNVTKNCVQVKIIGI